MYINLHNDHFKYRTIAVQDLQDSSLCEKKSTGLYFKPYVLVVQIKQKEEWFTLVANIHKLLFMY